MDEKLLRRLDHTDEAKRDGRSAVIRRAVTEYLKRKEDEEIDAQYERAYTALPPQPGEFDGWEEAQVWPEDWDNDELWRDY